MFFSLYTPPKLSSVQNQSNEGDNMAGIRKFMWSLFSQNSKFARAVSKANFKPILKEKINYHRNIFFCMVKNQKKK